MDDEGRLGCRRCGAVRPPVCQQCGAGRFANLRPGVARLREELEAAAARPVAAVTGTSDDPPADVPILVGTEAVLHRARPADVVAFLEFDSEMLAPRYRAGEEALSLLIRGARLAPHVMLQTFVPDHPVIRAAAAGDPGLLLAVERERRAMLSLPPFGALAAVSGVALDDYLAALPTDSVTVGRDGGRALVRAPDWDALAAALAVPARPDGNHLRIEVDPPRV
jgi:primosomal protein N' (replication factor Y)